MNLLLILSALLTALTGVDARRERVGAAVAQRCVVAATEAAQVRAVVLRPVQALATLVANATTLEPILAPFNHVPLWVGRRRE